MRREPHRVLAPVRLAHAAPAQPFVVRAERSAGGGAGRSPPRGDVDTFRSCRGELDGMDVRAGGGEGEPALPPVAGAEETADAGPPVDRLGGLVVGGEGR